MKKGDVRKQTIMEAAEKLFYEKGYENTSVQDVLDALNFSKGGFYHHFESKLKLLEEICEQRTEEVFRKCESAVRTCQGNSAEKLNALLSLGSLFSQDSMDFIGLLIRVAYRDGSVMLRDSLKRTTMHRLLPLMNEIIEEGRKTQLFYTAHPEHIGRLLLLLAINLTDEISELLAKARSGSEELLGALDLLDAYRRAVELLLNAPYGSIIIFDMERIMQISEEMARQDRRIAWASSEKK